MWLSTKSLQHYSLALEGFIPKRNEGWGEGEGMHGIVQTP
jgi:hypothetical protein